MLQRAAMVARPTSAAQVSDVLRLCNAAGVPVIVHPIMARAAGEKENLTFTLPARLRDAGIPFALQSGYEAYVPKTRVVLFEAGMAAAHLFARCGLLGRLASVPEQFGYRIRSGAGRLLGLLMLANLGLLEMSRQRLRPGMLESTTQPCPHCHGTGLIRSDDSMALQVLRALRRAGVAVLMHPAGPEGMGSMKSQFKKADASGARFALIFGADEVAQGQVAVKPLRTADGQPAPQRTEPLAEASRWAQSLR